MKKSKIRVGATYLAKVSGKVVPVRVVSAIVASWSLSVPAAQQFWTAVRDETESNPKAMSNKLARFLKSICVGLSPGITSDKKSVGSQETLSMCLSAWNAWRQGDCITLEYDSWNPVLKAI